MISRLQLNLRHYPSDNSTNFIGGGQHNDYPADKNYGFGPGLTDGSALTNTLPWKISDAVSFDVDLTRDVERSVGVVTTVNVVDTFFTVANLGESVVGPFYEDEMAGSDHSEVDRDGMDAGRGQLHLPPAKGGKGVYMV